MRMPSFLTSAVVAAATLLGSSAAFAGPLGVNLPAKFYIDAGLSFETAVANQNDILKGIIKVTNISDSSTAQQVYAYGQNNVYLAAIFNNFSFDAANTITDVNGIHLFFTGGLVQYYVSPTDTFTNSLGNVDADIAAITAGTLFLGLNPVVIDGLGHTLEITITAGTLGTFSKSGSQGFLDVDPSNPGAAGSFFNSDFFNGHDATFGANGASATAGSCGDFAVCGSTSVQAFLVPEPVTLSIFGAGLAGAAALRRRKAKKA